MNNAIKKFQYTSVSEIMTPANINVWNHLSVGVAVVDSNGYCIFMNDIQRKMDGFEQTEVIGRHITELYLPNKMNRIPTMECLRVGEPILCKTYTYKTAGNRSFHSVEDFIPLFRHGQKDGVLAICQWPGSSTSEESALPSPLPYKAENSTRYNFDSIIGKNPALRDAVSDAKIAAKSAVPVMIWGESGTGKELFAQAIHAASPRQGHPFIAINCAAIPENLLEGILFGTVKGAYTDAADKPGLFEKANGGTLLLDELNSMPLGLQTKLLRVLQEKRVRRVGSQVEKQVDVRVISVLNEAPLTAVEQGHLRSDLYYRLAVVGISVPPLRERREDIPLLVTSFLEKNSADVAVAEDVQHLFWEYRWPGNIRELLHVIEGSLALLGDRRVISRDCLPKQFYEAYQETPLVDEKPVYSLNEAPPVIDDYRNVRRGSIIPLKEKINAFEARCIRNVLRVTGGNIAKAARIMDLTGPGLRYKMKQLGISDDDY